MTAIPYSIASGSEEFSGATVFLSDGSVHSVANDNPQYDKLVAGLIADALTEEEVLNIISPFDAVYRTLTRLSERVSRKGNKLLFDGDVLRNSLTEHIIKIMNEGSDEKSWVGYIRFMEKLYTNPSEQSREHLFLFVDSNGLTVTEDGDLVLYKGVGADGKSWASGYGIVDGVEYQNDRLPNYPGAVVEIPRSMVDDNRNVACSVGLHAASYKYAAETFRGNAPKLLTVLVNPRDVVSVPSDHQDTKLRVSRYVVVEENDARDHYDVTTVSKFNTVDEPVTPEVPTDTQEQIITIDTKSQKIVPGSRVAEYEDIIEALIKQDPNYNLKKYMNKRVTSGRRSEFAQAAKNKGFKLWE